MARWQRTAQLLEALRSQLQQARGAKASTTKLPVMLLQDVEALGGAGKFTKVHHGYARNYLIPQRKAIISQGGGGLASSTSSGEQGKAEEEAAVPHGLAQQQRQAEAAIKKLISTTVVIKRKTADGQQLDAAVGREDMVEAVARQLRVELHPGLLDIGEDRLAVVGEYRLPLKLVLASGEQAMLDLTISST